MSTVEYRIVPGDDGYRVGADGSFWTCLVRRYGGRGVRYERSGDWRRVEPLPPHGPAGYLRVSLRGKPVELHSLVLRTFRGPKPEGQQGRHLDGNSLNCAVENLAWRTPLENAADRAIHGRDQIGETHWKAALTASQVLEIRHLAGTMSQAQLAAMFGVSQTCVWLIDSQSKTLEAYLSNGGAVRLVLDLDSEDVDLLAAALRRQYGGGGRPHRVLELEMQLSEIRGEMRFADEQEMIRDGFACRSAFEAVCPECRGLYPDKCATCSSEEATAVRMMEVS